MSFERIDSVYRTNNQCKGFNSYFVGKRKKSNKFTALPSDMTVGKPKKKTWIELLDPWLIVGGFVLLYGLLNKLIGG